MLVCPNTLIILSNLYKNTTPKQSPRFTEGAQKYFSYTQE